MIVRNVVFKSRLRAPRGRLQTSSCEQSRSIFMVRSKKQTKAVDRNSTKRNEKILDFVKDEDYRKAKQREAEYKKRLQELKNLTAEVSQMLDRNKKEEELKNLPMASDLRKDSESVYQRLEDLGQDSSRQVTNTASLASSGTDDFNAAQRTLLTPSIELPETIKERLGLAVKFLVTKHNQNWLLVLQQLQLAGGFKDVPPKDVRKFLYAMPLGDVAKLHHIIEQMLVEADIEISPKILNVFILGLSQGGTISDQNLGKIETYVSRIYELNKGKKLPRDTYELMIRVHGKRNDLEKINHFLGEMKANKLEPSPVIYLDILSTCVYKARDHKQAVEIFDTLKFLSQKTKPDTRAYQDIIVSYVNNNDIEKALDLYREMLNTGVSVNQKILVALAKGCISREELKLKAWDFMFDIYNNGWEPSLETYEYMMYLASKDFDVSFTRALYSKLNESGSLTAKAFTFLMLAYSRAAVACKIDCPPSSITFHETGRIFRRNILSDLKYTGSSDKDESVNLPFLPFLDLKTKREILAESSAMWAYTLIHNPEFINSENTNTYLNIAAHIGSIEDFEERFNSTTYLDVAQNENQTRFIIDESEINTLKDDDNNEDTDLSKTKTRDKNSMTTSPLLQQLGKTPNLSVKKVARTSLTYVIALNAAGNCKNYPFAQKIWVERGLFRKSPLFTNLSRDKKNKLDFEFASAMVSSLAEMNLLQDALAILVSTEYQFKWTWRELHKLYEKAEMHGHDKLCKTIKGIVHRAQINFEGKLRRRDYREYVKNRGY